MSSFEFGDFCGDDRIFAVSKSKHSEAEADALLLQELEIHPNRTKKMTGYVYYGLGYDEDHERVVGYWFSESPRGKHPQECWAYVLG